MTVEVKKPEFEAATIVAIGSFNPMIFHPLWFSQHDLIRPEEGEKARVEIVHADMASFTSEWLGIQVLRERFSADTKDASMYLPLRDLVLNTFSVLEHTPITAFGFNRWIDIPMESEEQWHALGHYYAPKQSWQKILKDPGLNVLNIQGKIEGCKADRVSIRLQPSPNIKYGVSIRFNYHYEAPKSTEEEKPANYWSVFTQELDKAWPEFLTYSGQAATQLVVEGLQAAR